MHYLKLRIDAFRKRLPRIRTLRKARVNTVVVARAAGTPMLTYGCDVIGMSNSHLDMARRCLSRAVAPEAGVKSFELVLCAADGARATLDPDAHTLPVFM